MADITTTTSPSKAKALRHNSSGLHRYQRITRERRHRERVRRAKIETKRKMKALQAVKKRENPYRELFSELPIHKKLRTLQDERYNLIQQVSDLRQENCDLKALAANPEAASSLKRTQQELNKKIAELQTHLCRLQDESQSKKDKKNEQLKAKVRDLELAVKLAERRLDEMKEIVRDV
ncbi:hypothetical protein H2200_011206 [Cladophialophora chaetospira]|uniref:Uncharacterized protein n=1 Tax=Cladophialophora chaetospira TaxID=386627 RepID=A0AA39CDN8_9EURO|nr:hypothetical protein H2200_011206 [Cladophialophora chaetospira]